MSSFHFGGAKFLQDHYGTHVYMSAEDWDVLDRLNGTKPKRDLVATDGQKFTLGDTTVTMYFTPGHTPGHHSLLVKLKEKGSVVLMGDLAHFHENYDSNGVPSFNTDRAETLASLDRVKKIAANLKATIVIQHDARDIGKLPAFPASAK